MGEVTGIYIFSVKSYGVQGDGPVVLMDLWELKEEVNAFLDNKDSDSFVPPLGCSIARKTSLHTRYVKDASQ